MYGTRKFGLGAKLHFFLLFHKYVDTTVIRISRLTGYRSRRTLEHPILQLCEMRCALISNQNVKPGVRTSLCCATKHKLWPDFARSEVGLNSDRNGSTGITVKDFLSGFARNSSSSPIAISLNTRFETLECDQEPRSMMSHLPLYCTTYWRGPLVAANTLI